MIVFVIIKYVIDHYRIVNFEIVGFLCYCVELVGCIVIILYKMFRECGFEIKFEIVGLMLLVIILDSLFFKLLICI